MAAKLKKVAETSDNKASGLGLEAVGNLSSLLSGGSDGELGRQEIALDLIDEDDNQPRKFDNPGFAVASLKELAVTIEKRGVKSPISVRTGENGRYIINHGARRYRASLMAGKATIPAFVDDDYSEADQVIENLQRDALTAREIADFIGRQKASGATGKQIAEDLGKSPAWVSQHVALLDLPDCLAELFASGRLRDVTLINELLKVWKKYPQEVETWLDDEGGEITRSAFKAFLEYLEQADGTGHSGEGEGEGDGESDGGKESKEEDKTKLKRAILFATYNGRDCRLVTNLRPGAAGMIWIKIEDGGETLEVFATDLTLTEIVEG